MALYSGVEGKISIQRPGGEEKDIVYASGFTVSQERNIREVLRLNCDDKEKRGGLRDWTGSSNGKADFSPDGGQRELQTAYDNAEPVTVTFYLAPGVFKRGQALIESLEVGLEADDDATMDISLSGTGRLETVYTGDTTPSELKKLTIACIPGGIGEVAISIQEDPAGDNVFVYKVGVVAPSVTYNEILATWDILPTDGVIIGLTSGQKITVAEVDSNNRAKAAGSATVVVGT